MCGGVSPPLPESLRWKTRLLLFSYGGRTFCHLEYSGALLNTRQRSPQPWKTAVRIVPGVPAEALRAGAGCGEQLGKAWT